MWLTFAALVVVGVGVTLVAVPTEHEWTTSSPEALAAFEAAMDAQMKLYYVDAREHIQRAVELDPDFLVAKLMSVDSMYREDKEQAEKVLEEVLAEDISRLTPREQFFIERARAYHEERREDIDGLLDRFLAEAPNDPYLLNQRAIQHWSRGEFDEAEPLYMRLKDIAPNWVIAYNQLGYINLSRGRFAEAEEYFKSYRFIAPDQANPYDSLGELFVALGRYDEAEESFERAIEIKPDFWAAYEHIAVMKTFNGDLEGAREIIDRGKAADIPEGYATAMGCLEQSMAMYNARSWKQILEFAENSSCLDKKHVNFSKISTHLAACELERWETAEAIEAEVEEIFAKAEESAGPKDLGRLYAAIEHMRGVRLALQGDYASAAEKLRSADQTLTYIEVGSAIFKLYNQMIIAELLLADGKDADAHELMSKVRGVNPEWVAEFEESGHKVLGLKRG
jgi:tetratricopeptide (TPR) repeat protein